MQKVVCPDTDRHFSTSLSDLPTALRSRIAGGLRLCRVWLSLLILTGGSSALADDAAPGYQLGRGYALGDTGITLGGYASAHLDAQDRNPWYFNLNSLSAFVTWDNGSKLRFFSETEAENILTAGGNQRFSDSDTNLHFERLYLDYLATDKLSIRLGKFLTPVGQWNLIHVDPLVWTTTRPIATYNLFAPYATGVMLQGSIPFGEQFLEFSLFNDYSSVLDPSPHPEGGKNFDNSQGLRLQYHFDDSFKVGVSYADYALTGTANTRNHLLGFDFAWNYQRFAINSEVVYRSQNSMSPPKPLFSLSLASNPLVTRPLNPDAWQGYIQGVAPLTASLYAVGRYEFFDQPDGMLYLVTRKTGQAEVFGLAYRPSPPLVFKLEYRTGKDNRYLAADGMFASFSVLF